MNHDMNESSLPNHMDIDNDHDSVEKLLTPSAGMFSHNHSHERIILFIRFVIYETKTVIFDIRQKTIFCKTDIIDKIDFDIAYANEISENCLRGGGRDCVSTGVSDRIVLSGVPQVARWRLPFRLRFVRVVFPREAVIGFKFQVKGFRWQVRRKASMGKCGGRLF